MNDHKYNFKTHSCCAAENFSTCLDSHALNSCPRSSTQVKGCKQEREHERENATQVSFISHECMRAKSHSTMSVVLYRKVFMLKMYWDAVALSPSCFCQENFIIMRGLKIFEGVSSFVHIARDFVAV
jgi:hypothetical protein